MNLEGVQEAHVTFEPPQAIVRYDPSTITPEALIQATANAGYPSKLTSSS